MHLFLTLIGIPLGLALIGGFCAGLAGATSYNEGLGLGFFIAFLTVMLYLWIALWCGVHRRVRDSGAPTYTTAIGFVCSLFFAPLALLLWLVLCFAKTGQFGEPITEGSSTDRRESTPMATKFNRPA